MNKFICVFYAILFGGIFLTSEKFVNTNESPKFYFSIALLIGCVLVITLYRQSLRNIFFIKKNSLLAIVIICLIQALYGICQYLGFALSNHSTFIVTGSFDNPAGFAAVLSIGFPISLFLNVKSKSIVRYISIVSISVCAIAIFLSGSRTGLLTIFISSIMFLLFETKENLKNFRLKYIKLLSISIIGIFIFTAYILYNQKKDSADGRLLIWKVSFEMIKDKPVFGHGYGAFQAKYMNYQAMYFKNNQNSKFALLADNVKHPFNEYIKIAVEFGIVGLLIILSLIILFLRKTLKSKDTYQALRFCGLFSFLLFAFFSYPLSYISVWLLLILYFISALPLKIIRIKNKAFSFFARCIVILICSFIIFNLSKQIQAEIKWKTIAVNSLSGRTLEMLPEYEKLYSSELYKNPFFLYNYGAELNFIGKSDESIEILSECQQYFNDYDLQMLLADNYNEEGEIKKAIEIYRHASFMIPCRFLPIYKLFEIYKKNGKNDMAKKYAKILINKKVKVPSVIINEFQLQAKTYLDN